MRAAILAAGWGERLREGGVDTPKPLVRVADRTLLHHALGAVRDAGADRALVCDADRDAGCEGSDRTTGCGAGVGPALAASTAGWGDSLAAGRYSTMG